jgi:hypothetical protein
MSTDTAQWIVIGAWIVASVVSIVLARKRRGWVYLQLFVFWFSVFPIPAGLVIPIWRTMFDKAVAASAYGAMFKLIAIPAAIPVAYVAVCAALFVTRRRRGLPSAPADVLLEKADKRLSARNAILVMLGLAVFACPFCDVLFGLSQTWGCRLGIAGGIAVLWFAWRSPDRSYRWHIAGLALAGMTASVLKLV